MSTCLVNCCGRPGLEARIAELEGKLETTSERAQWDLDWRIEAEQETRKVDAELEKAEERITQTREILTKHVIPNLEGTWPRDRIDTVNTVLGYLREMVDLLK